jgi:hypothetical protein
MAASGAGVATWQLEPTCLLAAAVTHQLSKLMGLGDVCDVAMPLTADLQSQGKPPKPVRVGSIPARSASARTSPGTTWVAPGF